MAIKYTCTHGHPTLLLEGQMSKFTSSDMMPFISVSADVTIGLAWCQECQCVQGVWIKQVKTSGALIVHEPQAPSHNLSTQADTLRERLFQALGTASVCWDTPENAGVFHAEECVRLGEVVWQEMLIFLSFALQQK